jgi:hypothetical protein
MHSSKDEMMKNKREFEHRDSKYLGEIKVRYNSNHLETIIEMGQGLR